MNWGFGAALVLGFGLVVATLLLGLPPAARRVGVGAAGIGIAGLSASFAGLGGPVSVAASILGAALLIWYAERTAAD